MWQNVTSVTRVKDEVVVGTEDGRKIVAKGHFLFVISLRFVTHFVHRFLSPKACIVTSPLNALSNIDFSPALSPLRQEVRNLPLIVPFLVRGDRKEANFQRLACDFYLQTGYRRKTGIFWLSNNGASARKSAKLLHRQRH